MTDFESVKRFLNQFHSLAGIKMELDYFIKNGTYFFKKVCNSKRRAEKLLLNIKKAENVVIDAIGELNPCERKVVTELIIKNKSRYTVIIENYISEATLYRTVNKIAFIIYKRICKSKETEKTFFYVINCLQN